MKILLLFLSLFIFLSSCQTFQYFTIDSSQVARGDRNDFVTETDTLLLRYSFSGLNGPVKITVYNKLDVPLVIDWKQSALIIDEEAYAFYSPNSKFNGELAATNVQWSKAVGTQYGTMEGDIRSQEGMEFIPPKSFKMKSALFLVAGYQKSIDGNTMTKIEIPTNAGLRKMRAASFDSSSSPLRFRIYLSVHTGENLKITVAYNHSFFISQVIKGNRKPRHVMPQQDGGDRFYTTKLSHVGVGTATMVGFGVLAAASIVAGDH